MVRIIDPLKPLAVPIDSVRPDPRNARKHPPRNIEALKNSLKAYGQRKPIVVNKAEDNRIIAGNGLWQAAKELGWEYIAAVFVEDDPATATGYALMDNSSALLAEWDFEQLETLIQELREEDFALELTGFDVGDLDFVGAEVVEEDEEFVAWAVDKAEELREKWETERGQVWEIPSIMVPGQVHRVMCGDSADEEDVVRLLVGQQLNLLVSDPPYGVSYAEKNQFLNVIDKGNRVQAPIVADHMAGEEMQQFWCNIFRLWYRYLVPGACYYITGPQGGELLYLLLALRDSQLPARQILIWAKNNHVLGRSDYHYKHEPIVYGWKGGSAHKFRGGTGETSLWEIPRPVQSELHPTAKPVELFARAIKNSSDPGDIVGDPFLGSGTTIVACEQLGRVGYGMEIEPKYVAVTLERLAQLGLEPRLVED